MTDSHDPVDSGRHLLGPHVVGQRIVIRRVLPGRTGPSGGPALTDLLGVCVAWEDGVCVVQPADGSPVSIPFAQIVSGKPVPPRPSVRLRVSARDAETHTVSLFPGAVVETLGEWALRWESAPVGRLRKRANSCLAMGSPGVGLPAALDSVAGFYTARDRDPLVQVEASSSLEYAITELGWTPVAGDSDFLVTSAAMLRRHLRGVAGLVSLVEEDGQAVATIGDGGPVAWARGRAALDDDWLGVHDVYVETHRRRQGLARLLMSELLDWGAEQGARTVWLHVETDNLPALALYGSLGFTRHHGCRYFRPPE